MKLTKHAELRGAQRSISEYELTLLATISIEVNQKGGTALITVPKSERSKWASTIRTVISLLDSTGHVIGDDIRKKKKALKRLLEHLSAKNMPYLVVSEEEDKVITCGHLSSHRIKRNH